MLENSTLDANGHTAMDILFLAKIDGEDEVFWISSTELKNFFETLEVKEPMNS